MFKNKPFESESLMKLAEKLSKNNMNFKQKKVAKTELRRNQQEIIISKIKNKFEQIKLGIELQILKQDSSLPIVFRVIKNNQTYEFNIHSETLSDGTSFLLQCKEPDADDFIFNKDYNSIPELLTGLEKFLEQVLQNSN